MLKIVEGGFNSGISEQLSREILKRTENKLRTLLIVPEQQTVTAEAEMCELLSPSAPLFFEATNFTRLANSVFRALGGVAGEYCTKDVKSLVMWRTLTELSPVLTMTAARAEISSGLIERALSAVMLAENHGIGAVELTDVLENENVSSNARLKSKVNDLALITALYKKLLSEKYQDAKDDLAQAAEALIKAPDFLSDTEIYVDGFTSFTEPQYKLLSVLMQRTSLTVALNIPKSEASSFEFAELRRTRDKLISVADKASSEKKLLRLDGAFSVKSELLAEAERLLWRSEGVCTSENYAEDSLRIFEAQDPFDESALVASDIRRRVTLGASFSDFAIITRQAEKYRGILDNALRDYAIPYFASYRKNVISYEAVRLIFAAYSTVTHGFSREDIMTYAKCGLTGIDEGLIDELELYCDKWQISGSAFTGTLPWNMNPRGYDPNPDAEKLLRINSTRFSLIEPLLAFGEDVNAAKTVREHAEALVHFLLSLRIEDKLIERAERLSSLGENAAAEDSLRLWGIICESLDTVVSCLGDTSASHDAFQMQLRAVFTEKNIGSIPSYIDEVIVGSADMIRLKNKKHVYLIGVNSGEFPASVSEDDYFTDRDKESLEAAGLTFTADKDIKSARELYSFRRAFAFATESVTLTYSSANAKQKATPPSDVISRILEICCGRIEVKRTSDMPVLDFIYTPASAILRLRRDDSENAAVLCEVLGAQGYGQKAALRGASITNDTLEISSELCSEIYSSDLALTQSRIDSYVDCPLSYFCKYELKLSDTTRAEFGANNVGTFVHAILENFFRAMRDGGLDAKSLGKEERLAMTRSAAKKYLTELFPDGNLGGARMKVMLSRLERASVPVIEGLCKEFSDCKFLPKFFELKIKSDSPDSPAPVTFEDGEGRRVYVYGTIDRVDAFAEGSDVYVRVIDYKTGAKQFSPDDLEKGRNLQMFLYLKSIIDTQSESFKSVMGVKEGGKMLPAGVIYVHTSISDTSVKRENELSESEALAKTQKRAGMLLCDEASISAMNRDFLPVSFDKAGEIKEKDRLYTQEEWEKLSETIERSVLAVADGIRRGCVSPPSEDTADKKVCGYCEYKAFCRRAKI